MGQVLQTPESPEFVSDFEHEINLSCPIMFINYNKLIYKCLMLYKYP